MSVNYSGPTISGYNANPPPNDASQVSANELDWDKHKQQLADPIKTLAEAINTAVESAVSALEGAGYSSGSIKALQDLLAPLALTSLELLSNR